MEYSLQMSSDIMADVFGMLDGNIRKIESAFGVRIVNRGEDIKISGGDTACAQAVKAVTSLTAMAAKGEPITEQSVNYIIGMVIGTIGTYILWKYVIRQIPFPMRKHLLIFIALLVVYSVVMYLLVWLLNNFVQPIAAISMNFLGWSIVYWVISVAIFLARLYFYGHNPAVVSRV